jgi:hypothetical protein
LKIKKSIRYFGELNIIEMRGYVGIIVVMMQHFVLEDMLHGTVGNGYGPA